MIGGTPDTVDADTASVTVTVTDTAGNSAEVSLTFPKVDKGDQSLAGFEYSSSSITYGDSAPTVTAPPDAVGTLSYTATPAEVCTVVEGTGALKITGAGTCEVTVTAASTDEYNEATAKYTVTVNTAGTLSLNVAAIATDNTVNIAEKTAGFSISGDTGSEDGVSVSVEVGSTTLTATSSTADPATWSVSVPAEASYITGTSVAVSVTASKAGFTAPSAVTRTLAVDLVKPAVAYTAPASLKVGAAVDVRPTTTDTDLASYSASGLPSGLSVNTSTGVIGGTPDTVDADTAEITVTVTDTAGNPAEVSLTFPNVDKGDQSLTGFEYSSGSITYGDTAPTVTAPNGAEGALSYTATPAEVCTVVEGTGELTIAGVGACEITVTAASTDSYNEGTAKYTVTVNAVGTLSLSLDAIATDNTINIAEKTAGFSISGDTGSEAGVSVSVAVGSTTLTATSADVSGTATWSVNVPAEASYITGTSVAVSVSASKAGFTAPTDVTRTLAVDLAKPAVSYSAPSSLKVGASVDVRPTTTDTDLASYAASGLPSGLSINASSGAITGAPDTVDADTAEVTVTVTDTAGNPAEVAVTFPAVGKGDQTLTGFEYSSSNITFGDTTPTVTAPDGAVGTLSYTATPSTVCTVAEGTGALTIVGAGACVITVTAASTDEYEEATATYTVTVNAAGTLSLNLDAIATDNTVNIAEKAAGFSISGDTGSEGGVSVSVEVGSTTLTATSSTADPATWSVSVPSNASYITGTSVGVTVSASKAGFTAPTDVTRTLAVDLVKPAVAYTAPATLKVGAAVNVRPTTTDTDLASYSATGLPSGLSIDTSNGAITGMPDTVDADTASVTVTVTDNAGNPAEVSLTFPKVDKGDQTLTGFEYSSSSITFGDTAPTLTTPDGAVGTLSYTATPEAVCTVDGSSGALTIAGAGDCEVTVTAASTDEYEDATAKYTVTVNAAGTLSLSLDAIATDNTVNIAEKTAGFSISGDTGSESGVTVSVTIGSQSPLTATSADVSGAAEWSVSVPSNASYIMGTSVAVSVTASKAGFTAPSAVTRTLAVDLAKPSVAYTAPASLKVGASVDVRPTTTDTDLASYSATGLPSGLSIDTSNGTITGEPDTVEADTASVTVTVTDTAGNPAEVSITFPAVAKGDQSLAGFEYSASSITFGDAAPTVTAPPDAVGTLSYTATPEAVCTVDGSSGALTIAGAGDCEVTVTAASTDEYEDATAKYTVTVNAAGTLSLNVAAIATDNTVNIAEKAAGFSISGDTGSESGVTVSVTIGSQSPLTATSADVSGTAEWSVNVRAAATYITGTSVAVTVSASKTGFTPPTDVERSLTVDLSKPSVTYTAPASLKVGAAVDVRPTTTDTDIASYSASGLPSGLSIDTSSGAITGEPDTVEADTASVTVTVTDTAGNPAEVSLTFPKVDKGDQSLAGFGYSSSSITYGDTAPTVTAPPDAVGTLSYTATPEAVCTVDGSSGALTIVGAGDCEVTVTAASTDEYEEGTAKYTVTVNAAGTLSLSLDAIATDNTVNIAEKTAGFSISGDTGSEAGVSVSVAVGTTTLTATSADVSGTAEWSVSVPAEASYITGTSVAVSVTASKTGFTAPSAVTRTLAVDLVKPSVTYTAPASLKVGASVDVRPTTTDTDLASYSASGLPSGLSINGTTGAITGEPDTLDADTAEVTVTVTDTAGNPADVSITFPMVAKGDQSLTGFEYSSNSITYGDTAPTLTAPDGAVGTLSYAVTPEEVCTVDGSSGALTIVGAGACEVTVTAASTDKYNEGTAKYTVTVNAVGTLSLSLDAIATDNTVNIAEKTAGFSISGDTGSEAGVSVSVAVGTTTLTATSADVSGTAEWLVSVPSNASYVTGTSVAVSVTASKAGFTAPSAVTRTLAVDLVKPAVTYTAPSTLKVGAAVDVQPTTTDTDLSSYSATGLPSGLSIHGTTGAITGEPDTVDADTASVTVTVTDTAGNPAEVSLTFPKVDKGDQSLAGFEYSSSSITFGDAAPTVTAPPAAVGTLSYTATPAEVCTVVEATGALRITGAGTCEVTVTAASTDEYNEGTAKYTVTVNAVGTLSLNLDAIATDNTVNIAEKTAGFSISGDTGSEAGVAVSVAVGMTTLTTTSADVSGTAEWSVNVPAAATYITGTSVSVTVSASKTGFTPPTDVERSLTVDLVKPAVTYTAPASLKVGASVDVQPTTTDTDLASYSASGLPSGLSVNGTTGAITGTPDTVDADTASVTVTVMDTAGNPAEVSLTFPKVDKGDQSLSGFEYSSSSITFGDTAPTLTAPDGAVGTLSYAATSEEVCTVDGSSGALTIVGAGDCEVTVTAASTDSYEEGTAKYTVTVNAAGTLSLSVDAIATDNTVNIAEKAAGFSISGDTGSEAGVTVSVAIGATTLTATSADVSGTAAWSVSVPSNASYITGTSVAVSVSASKAGFTAPSAVTRTLAIDLVKPAVTYTAPASLKVGASVDVQPTTTDTDLASYSATGLPSGLSINGTTGAITGAPDTVDADTASVTVTVTDTAGNPAEVSLTFPKVDKGDQSLAGFEYSSSSITFGDSAPTVTAPPAAVGTLSYTATPAEVCTVVEGTGALTIVGAGTCEVTVTAASTDEYNEATAKYTVTVNAAGTLSLSLDAIATDNTVNIAEKTAGFSISGDTGSEAGVSVSVAVGTTTLTATSADVSGTAEWSVSVPSNATYITGTSVTVSVTASKAGYTAPSAVTRTLMVDLVKPSVSYGAPASLKVGAAVDIRPTTTDTDLASYSASGLPSGLSIDTSNGTISGEPDTVDADTASVTVTVTDNAGNPAEVSITFPKVDKGDQSLTGFEYSASSITFGDSAPTVTAPDGAVGTLSYAATPEAVCTVDGSSGALTIVGAGTCEVTVTAASTDKYNEGTAKYTLTVNAAGTLSLNLDAIATDNTVNIAEKAAGFSISGDTGSEAGVSVSVAVGSTTLTATSADVSGTAEWSVSVPAAASYITGTSVTVSVTASKTGFTAPSAVTRTLAVDLVKPSVTYTAPSSLKVGASVDVRPTTTDTDLASYAATGLPSGLSINSTTGAISGAPDTVDADTVAVTVTVTDTAGNPAELSTTFPMVEKGDQSLSGFEYSSSSITFGDTAPTLTAPDGAVGTLSYAATSEEVCTVDGSSGALTIVGAGTCEVTVTAASTDKYNEGTAKYTVTVNAAGTLSLNLDAIATDNTVNIAEKAAGFSISGDTGSEAGVSVSVVVGSTTLTATSADVSGTAEWSVNVPAEASYITGTSVGVTVSASKAGFTAPSDVTRTLAFDLVKPSVAYTAPSSLKVGAAVDVRPTTTDTDLASYAATGLPSGLSINSTTGAITGTPDTVDADTASVTVTVTDTAGNPAEVSITFPMVAKGDQSLTGFEYSASSITFGDTAPTLTAPDGAVGTLSYAATPAEVCTVVEGTGALTIVGAGTCEVTVTAASTDKYNEGSATYTVTVNAAGTLSLNLDAVATDNTVNIAEKTAGFSISGDTGSEAGVTVSVAIGATTLTATSADVSGTAEWSVAVPSNASYITGTSMTVSVTASKAGFTAPSAVTRTLTIDLAAPSATYNPPSSLKLGMAITAMTPSTTHTDIDSYAATGLPSGLAINTSTGVISGTPDIVVASATVTVTVTDTAGNPATTSISFPAVGKGDQTLTGFAYSSNGVSIGDAAPTLTAPDGAVGTLSYTATPEAVCTVDRTSGALTIVGVGVCVITATAASTDSYNEGTASYSVTVNATGTLSLKVAVIATDNAVNIAEKAAGFSISGNTGSEAGVSVSVAIGATTLTATSADVSGTAEWSVDVPAEASYITGTSVAVSVSASKAGFTVPTAVTRTLGVDLVKPALTYTAPTSLKVGAAVDVRPTTTDTDLASYSATGLPSGLSINATTGAISGTPDTVEADTASVTVTVTDTAGNPAEVSVTFPAVGKGDQTLTGFEYSSSSITFGDTTPTLTAPDGAVGTLSYAATPEAVCTVDGSSGALTIVGVGACEVTVTAASTDSYNEAMAKYTVTVNAVGTVPTGVTLTVTPANLDENAGTTTVTVTGSLGSAPRSTSTTVTVSVGASGDSATESADYTTVDDLTLTIGAGQLSGTATFTLTPADDDVDEVNEAITISGSTTAAGLTVTGTTITVIDDDERGVSIKPTSLSVPEGGSSTYSVVLISEPTGIVTVAIAGHADTDLTLDNTSLRFTASDWSRPQSVTVSAGQDSDAENDTATLTHSVTGADYGANRVTAESVSVTIDDDDVESRGVQLSLGRTSIDEGAGNTDVVVAAKLIGAPRDEPTPVAVSVGAQDDSAVAGTDYVEVHAMSLTIPSGQVSATATFVFSPMDDQIDERVEAVSITGTMGAEGFEVSGTTLSIADNDTRGVHISRTTLTVPEGGDETYTVALTSEPTGDVTVTPSVNGSSDVTVSGALTFTPTDWEQAQTVTVTAADDADGENDTATISHAIGGADYGANGVTPDDVSVTVDDDETAVRLTVDPEAVDEGAGATTVTVTATLDGVTRAEPTAVAVSVGVPGDAAVAGRDYLAVDDLSLTIPSGEASGMATFTLTPLDNFVDEPDAAMSIAGTTGAEGLEVTGTTLAIADDDERGVQISPAALTVPEGGDAAYTVMLTSEPGGEVTVTPSVNGSSDVTVSAALTFTATDWDQAQTVTVSAARDADAANDTAAIEHSVAGAEYGANSVTPGAVPVTVEDAETAVTLTVNPAAVGEDAGATTVTVTATLDGAPRAGLTILTLSVGTSDDGALVGTDYAAVDDLSLIIPPGQATGTATFMFTPMEDLIDEPDEAVSITGTGEAVAFEVAGTSGGLGFEVTSTVESVGFEVIGTTLAIADEDERGVTVSPHDLTLSEGASAAYTVVLDTEPTGTVTITPSVSGSPDLTFEPSSLTFTASDWNTAQTMTVAAAEDGDAYHDSSIVSHAADGADYVSLVGGELSVTIADDEAASDDTLPAQVTGASVAGTATHVDLNWAAVEDTVSGYRIEASYDGGANWAEVEANTGRVETAVSARFEGSADATETVERRKSFYRHSVGLNFSESRLYRVSAVGESGAGLPSTALRASATSTAGGLTTAVRTLEDAPDLMLESAASPLPAVDLCWIPEGVATSDLSDVAMAMSPVRSSDSSNLGGLPWQSVGTGSVEVDCVQGIGFRLTSISKNQRYAFRMRAERDGVWLVSNEARAVLADSSRPLRTVVTAGASGVSGDSPVPELLCRDYDDPAMLADEEGSFFVTVGFTTADEEYQRYEPVNGFDAASDLTLVNAAAERLDQAYDTQLGYRVRITPGVWGEPVAVSVPADVVTHAETGVDNQASGELRVETSDAEDCATSAPEPVRRSKVTAARIDEDGDRDGVWTAFEPIRVTLRFDERVSVDTTGGVPGVTVKLGETAAAEQTSDSGAATEVTVPFAHVADEDALVFEHLVTADESPISDITLLADSLALNGGRIDSFSGPAVDLSHPEANVVGGQFAQPDLTAHWSMIPAAHEGSESSFEIHLRFSEDVDPVEVIGEQNLIDHAFTVANGAIKAIEPARDRSGDYLGNEWTIRVAPASEEPVTIAPVVHRACDEPGAICKIDDRPLTEAPPANVHRIEQRLSVADAEVGEGPGAVLVFEVTLARVAEETVTVDYETTDGTATAGEDYEVASGTLRIEGGQISGRVQVGIIDDSHDEGEETLTLTLSNASGARIHKGEAFGVIVNSDPMPGAWLARFGRAASDHVAQAVARRLERGSREEFLTVGGVRVDRPFTSVANPAGGRTEPGFANMALNPFAPGAGQSPVFGAAIGQGNGTAVATGTGPGPGTGTLLSMPTGGFGAQGLDGDMTVPHARTSRGSDALMGSSFFHTFGASEDASSAPWAAWGETASTRFSGNEGALSLGGEVTTAMLGLDKRYGRWLVGSTLSYSEGNGDYRRTGALGGTMESTLTSLNPYAHFQLSETTSLWGVIGYGVGRLRLTPEGADAATETDLSNRLLAFGGRSVLSRRSGGFQLALVSDALLTSTSSESVENLVGATGATSRLRALLEGSGSMPLANGGLLKPTLEVGVRYDGGDAETGAGVEVGGGLAYAAGRLAIEVRGRVLLAHEDNKYEESGFSTSVAYTPSADGRGLSMKLGSVWGAAQSGVQSLWSSQDASGLARGAAMGAAQRFQAELGYGLAGRRKAGVLWVPFLGAEAAGGRRAVRMGVSYRSGPSLEMGLELGRREGVQGAGQDPGPAVQHTIELRGRMRW